MKTRMKNNVRIASPKGGDAMYRLNLPERLASLVLLVVLVLQSCADKIQLTQELAMASTSTTADSLLGAPKTQIFKQQVSGQVDLRMLRLRQEQNAMQPTGFHVDTSSTLTIHVRKVSGTELPKLIIGTPHDGKRFFSNQTWYQLQEGINNINTDTSLLDVYNSTPTREQFGGNAYIAFESSSSNGVGEVEITFESGFKKMPYYVKGITRNDDYQRMLDVFGDSVENAMLVSDRVILTFKVANARTFRSSDIDSLLLICDQVVEKQEKISGLDQSAPEHRPRLNRILITDKPSGSPTSGHRGISFPQGSMRDILTPSLLKVSWGFFHEIGHTYQQSWTWEAVKDATVNIYSLANERAMGITPSRLVSNNTWPIVTSYLAKSDSQRNYNTDGSLGHFGRLGMFHQLWLAYGDVFYQELHKRSRTDKPTLGNDDTKMAYFMETACDVAAEDLTDFFKKWGLPVTAETYTRIANKNLPKPNIDLTTLRD